MIVLYEAIAIILFFALMVFVTTVPDDLGCKELDVGVSTDCTYISEFD